MCIKVLRNITCYRQNITNYRRFFGNISLIGAIARFCAQHATKKMPFFWGGGLNSYHLRRKLATFGDIFAQWANWRYFEANVCPSNSANVDKKRSK
jgi:hypothetical protein